jgi:hypothetical protein
VPLAILVGGCGAASPHAPDVSRLPLVSGASVVAQAPRCDRGANGFCAVELVVVAPRFRDSVDLLKSERRQLRKLGWSGANGDTGDERAADSPGHRLRLTYATAAGDLKGIDLGWIDRSRAVTVALARALIARSPALSMMLEYGSG